jgi:hypothetical protein
MLCGETEMEITEVETSAEPSIKVTFPGISIDVNPLH